MHTNLNAVFQIVQVMACLYKLHLFSPKNKDTSMVDTFMQCQTFITWVVSMHNDIGAIEFYSFNIWVTRFILCLLLCIRHYFFQQRSYVYCLFIQLFTFHVELNMFKCWQLIVKKGSTFTSLPPIGLNATWLIHILGTF